MPEEVGRRRRPDQNRGAAVTRPSGIEGLEENIVKVVMYYFYSIITFNNLLESYGYFNPSQIECLQPGANAFLNYDPHKHTELSILSYAITGPELRKCAIDQREGLNHIIYVNCWSGDG